MTLQLCIRRLPLQEGVCWLVPDSESAIGALRTYQEGGHCRDGIHHQYAHTLGARCLASEATINIVVTPAQ